MGSSVVVGFVVLAALSSAPAEAKPTPAAKCLAAQFKAAAKKANAQSTCEAKAAATQLPVDQMCLTKAGTAFANAFSKADLKGGCTTPGDAGTVEPSIETFVQATAAALPGGSTKAGGKCAAAKRKAAGKKAASKLLCNAKAAIAGGAVDPGCLGNAEVTFANAFKKAEAKGGCATQGDASSIEQAVNGFVTQVASQLASGSTTTTTATSTTTTTSPLTVTVGPGGQLVFDPATLTIKVGDTVHWVWASPGHSVVSGTNGTTDNLFCSPSNTGCANPPLSPMGATYEHTFTQAGTFPYYCSVHFSLGMTGTITVQ